MVSFMRKRIRRKEIKTMHKIVHSHLSEEEMEQELSRLRMNTWLKINRKSYEKFHKNFGFYFRESKTESDCGKINLETYYRKYIDFDDELYNERVQRQAEKIIYIDGNIFSDISIKEAKLKYKELIKMYHPDNGGNAEQLEDVIRQYEEYKEQLTRLA